MNVEVRNIKHTELKLEPLEKLIRKYAQSLKIRNDIVVTFDKRLTKFDGWHYPDFNEEKKRHLIKVSPWGDPNSDIFKYSIISTILHELKHAAQIEEHGSQYHSSEEFSYAKISKNKEMSEYYSVCESEARSYENKHLNKAVDFYDDNCYPS